VCENLDRLVVSHGVSCDIVSHQKLLLNGHVTSDFKYFHKSGRIWLSPAFLTILLSMSEIPLTTLYPSSDDEQSIVVLTPPPPFCPFSVVVPPFVAEAPTQRLRAWHPVVESAGSENSESARESEWGGIAQTEEGGLIGSSDPGTQGR
jgi:hypothetical protein